jgi:hypothetical protein
MLLLTPYDRLITLGASIKPPVPILRIETGCCRLWGKFPINIPCGGGPLKLLKGTEYINCPAAGAVEVISIMFELVALVGICDGVSGR